MRGEREGLTKGVVARSVELWVLGLYSEDVKREGGQRG